MSYFSRDYFTTHRILVGCNLLIIRKFNFEDVFFRIEGIFSKIQILGNLIAELGRKVESFLPLALDLVISKLNADVILQSG